MIHTRAIRPQICDADIYRAHTSEHKPEGRLWVTVIPTVAPPKALPSSIFSLDIYFSEPTEPTAPTAPTAFPPVCFSKNALYIYQHHIFEAL